MEGEGTFSGGRASGIPNWTSVDSPGSVFRVHIGIPEALVVGHEEGLKGIKAQTVPDTREMAHLVYLSVLSTPQHFRRTKWIFLQPQTHPLTPGLAPISYLSFNYSQRSSLLLSALHGGLCPGVSDHQLLFHASSTVRLPLQRLMGV